MKTLTIGQLARAADVNPESIRFYEAQGLVPEPPRSNSGYRMYSSGAVQRLRFIKRAQYLGFSLKEIRELLSLAEDTTTDCADVRSLARAKVSEINQKILTLEAMKRSLTALADTCPGSGPSANCSILESINSEEIHDEN